MECSILLNVQPWSAKFLGDHIFIEDNGCIPRRHSMPPSPFRLSLSSNDIRNQGREEVLRRVRSFKKTSKGLENKGDFIRKGSSGSVISSGCQVTPADSKDSVIMGTPYRSRLLSSTSNDSGAEYSYASSIAPSYFRVLVLGTSGVGKSALINQFMSSENNGGIDDINGECMAHIHPKILKMFSRSFYHYKKKKIESSITLDCLILKV